MPNNHIATVTNNNQPGWTCIVETAPNVTLDIGQKLYKLPVKNLDDSPTWEHVINFAERMEKKLNANRHKGNRDGWLSSSKIALLRRIREELFEVDEKLFSSDNAQDIADECADVANFCMMLADKVLESAIPQEAE